MDIQELLCFGIAPGGGNAALVVRHDHSTTAQRQHFARERDKPACVFIDNAADGAVVLDYFYPHQRSPLCLHATLAAARVLLSPERPELRVRTAMHGQELSLSMPPGQNGIFIALAPQTPPAVAIAPDLPALLLAAPGLELASIPAIASVGSPKLLLEVADSATLRSLRPDLARITRWGKEHGVGGCYAWCRRADGAFEGRNFNHPEPAMEDSATGVAVGALTAHLGHGVRLYQGAQLGQPCRIVSEWRRDAAGDVRILIGGTAEIVTAE